MLNPHPQHGHLGMGCARAPRAGPGTCHSGPETCHSGPGTCHSGPGTCHRAPARLGARVGMKLCLGKLFISAFRTMGAMARSNRFRAGGGCRNVGSPEEACGAVQRQARSRVCRHQPVGQAAPSPVGLGFAAQPKSTETLGWLSPFRGANPEASCPSRLSHPPFCTSPLLSTAANSHRDQIHSYGRVNLPGRPPPALGREGGYSPLGLEDAFPQT